MNEVFLLLGSNLGDRQLNINSAISLLEKYVGKQIALSMCYETEPWGNENQPYFLNQCIKLLTPLEPFEVLEKCQFIESQLKRIKSQKWGARIIDIDILLFNNEVIKNENLTIPHRDFHKRKFALVCLNDIASDCYHPLLNKKISELLNTCKDNLSVNVSLNLTIN